MKARLLLFAATLLAASGCDLDQVIGLRPEDSVPSDQYFKTQDEVVNGINGVYGGLQNYWGTATTALINVNSSAFMWGEMRSDNTTFSYNPNGRAGLPTELVDHISVGDRPSITPNTSTAFQAWQRLYIIVRNANVMLDRIEKPEVQWATGAAGDSVKRRVTGEALFIRGLAYLELVRLYGGVPLVLQPVEDASDLDTKLFSVTRASEDEVYTRVVADADSAFKLLWTKQQTLTGTVAGTTNNAGRATKGAASMLAAKAYLEWAARTAPGANRTARYQKVIEKLDQLNASNGSAGYAVVADYRQIFNPAVKNTNAESIFEVQYSNATAITGENSAFSTSWGPRGGLPFLRTLITDPITGGLVYPSNQGGGGPWNIPTPDMALNGWAPGDARKDISLYRWRYRTSTLAPDARDVSYFDPTIVAGGDSVIPVIRKFSHTFTVQGQPNNNWIVFRYSDAVLMRAEALAELGNLAAATSELNRTRVAHGALAPLPVPASRTAFLEALLRERRSELAFESQRWWDLVRIRQTPGDVNSAYAIPVIRAHGNDMRARVDWSPDFRGKFSTSYNIAVRDLLLPIPFQETIRNPSLSAEQNPGY